MAVANDRADLFPDHGAAKGPRDGYAQRPIGTRRRRTPGTPKPTSPMLTMMAMLAGLRSAFDHYVGGIRLTLSSLDQEQRRITDRQADISEAMLQLQTRLVALERQTGLRPPPEIPTHTRRRPMR